MDFDLKIKKNDLTIFCSNGLENFSNEFINYFNENIDEIKEELLINKETKIIVALNWYFLVVNCIYKFKWRQNKRIYV